MAMRQGLEAGVVLALVLLLPGCDDLKHPEKHGGVAANAPPTPAAPVDPTADATSPDPAASPAAAAAPAADQPAAAPVASKDPEAQAIEAAAASPAMNAAAKRRLLVKAEVLLDRAHFSPGVIDGQQGSNLKGAIAAYRLAHGLPATGGVDTALLAALATGDTAPVTQDYVITPDDEKGPFLGVIPTDIAVLAKFDRLGYATPLQAFSEKFHMSQTLLRALNPKADFSAVGAAIVVLRPGAGDLPPVSKVEVDNAGNEVRALDASGKIVAVFPATVGSTERPAPDGEWAVKRVTANPNYTYDPKRLTFGDTTKGVLILQPGPNNPVGSTWIALTKDTYGIHGAPDPTRIGKVASHGCVRLTNWDATTLGRAVKKGTPVVFIGRSAKA